MGGPCDFSVSPSPNWITLVLGLGLGGVDSGVGLDNLQPHQQAIQTQERVAFKKSKSENHNIKNGTFITILHCPVDGS